MAQINVGLEFGREFEGELKTARAGAAIGMGEGQLRPYDMLLGALGACYYSTFVLTFTDKKEQSLAIIIVERLFRSQSRKASVVL